MKLSRDFGFRVLFPNDLYISQSGPFKLHRLCAISHTKKLSPSIALFGRPKDSDESVWTFRGRVN